MKIVHIITGLGDGGAEHTLYKICKYDEINQHSVISLKRSGKYFLLLKKLGIQVYNLDLKYYSIFKFFFLIKLLRSLKPNLVQTWLAHADFLGGIASRIAGIKNVFWNIRYSNIEIGQAKISTILLIKILAKLSFLIPKSIIIVSKKAKKIYVTKGFNKKKLKFIPNGYDLSLLRIKNYKKKKFKKKIKIRNTIPLIGNVARFDPLKGHLNLLAAISLVRKKNKEFFCVFSGYDINIHNFHLTSEIKRLKLTKHVKLLGNNNNITELMSSFDIFVQGSNSEGFPNVVAEAMAFKTPCVVTDVGDSSYIIGKTGWLSPPNDPKKLAKAIERAIIEFGKKNWNKKCNTARSRISEKFDIKNMINSYNRVWTKDL